MLSVRKQESEFCNSLSSLNVLWVEKHLIWRTCFVGYCRVCSAAHKLQSTKTWIEIFETVRRSNPAEDQSVICQSYIHLCLYTVLQYFTLNSGLPRVWFSTTQIIFNTLSEAGVEQHKSWRLELHLLLQCTHDLKEYFTIMSIFLTFFCGTQVTSYLTSKVQVFLICTFLMIKLKIAYFHPCWVYAHITRFHWGLQHFHWKPRNVKRNILCLDVANLNMQKCKISELWWRGWFSVSNLVTKNENSVIIYSPSWCSKSLRLWFIFETQMHLMKPESFC